MKAKVLFITLFSAICTLFASESLAQDKKGTEIVYFYIEGMNCENCQATIEKNVSFEKGVTDLICDLPTKMVAITYKTDKTNPKKLAKAFDKIKMPAKLVPVEQPEKEKK